MLNAAIIGLGWWGKNLVNSVQDKSERIHFEMVDTIAAFEAIIRSIERGGPVRIRR